MDFWPALILVIIFLFSAPYIRMFLKRMQLYFRLRSVCKTSNYSLIGNHRGWIFGARNGADCDFYMETPQIIYSVKLFPVKNRLQSLIIYDTRKYFIRKKRAYISPIGGVAVFDLDSKLVPLPEYNFRKNYRNAWQRKDFVPVLLIHPVCREILFHSTGKNETKPIDPDEPIFEMKIHSLSGLIRELKQPNIERDFSS